nr:hypothetical protein [Desulfobacterales bacterium]
MAQVRISRSEPTIAAEHLLKVLGLVPENFLFILETNGILIGMRKGMPRVCPDLPALHVRVSLKGTTKVVFSRLTGADPAEFELQLKALENLIKEGVSCHPPVMISCSTPKNVENLRKEPSGVQKNFFHFEEEELDSISLH